MNDHPSGTAPVAASQRTMRRRRPRERQFRWTVSDCRFLLDRLQVGCAITDTHGRFLAANPALIEIFGARSLAECQSQPVTRWYANSADREGLLARLLEPGRIRDQDIRMHRMDGRECWVRLNGFLLREGTGSPPLLLGFVEDVTTRKAIQNTLTAQADLLGSIGDNLPDGAVYRLIHTRDGRRFFDHVTSG